ncbi:MAG: hypothetical protein AAF533_14810 [Acidobacteriota bacterium]
MNCHCQPETEATRSCRSCLDPLCAECSQEVLGAFYCHRCLELRLEPEAPRARQQPHRLKWPFVASLLSMPLPGLGQVYNGLVARGLSQFAMMIIIVTITGMLEPDGPIAALFAFSIMGAWGWQVVDAWLSARDINRFGRIPDSDEAAAMGRGAIIGLDTSSKALGVGLMVVGGIVLANNLGLSRMLGDLIESAWPVALILGGAWLLRRGRDERVATRQMPPVPDLSDEALEREITGKSKTGVSA